MSQAEPAKLAVLASAALLDGVRAEDAAALLSEFRVQVVDDGLIFRQGEDSADGRVYVVLDGRVRVVRQVANNPPALVALLGPGEMFGELSAFDPGPRTASVRAVGRVVLASITRAQLLAWAVGRDYVVARLMQVLARRLRRTNDSTADLIFVDVPGRVARVLLDLAERFGVTDEEGTVIDHGLTQGQLADLVGASRETVNKALHQFVDRGWMELGPGRNSVRLLRPDRLEMRAGTRTPVA